jgi:AcrR family transcriptional regulator
MKNEPGLRERKKAERRDRIETAALELFERDGFEQTTIEDIAAASDIAPRTFFSYFPTKEDVVLANYASRLERIISGLQDRPNSEDPWNALRKSFMTVAADYESERAELIRRFTVIASNPGVYARNLQLQAGWESALAEALAQRSGTDAVSFSHRLMASAALGAMRSSLSHWMLTGHETPLPRLIQQSFDLLATGLEDQA